MARSSIHRPWFPINKLISRPAGSAVDIEANGGGAAGAFLPGFGRSRPAGQLLPLGGWALCGAVGENVGSWRPDTAGPGRTMKRDSAERTLPSSKRLRQPKRSAGLAPRGDRRHPDAAPTFPRNHRGLARCGSSTQRWSGSPRQVAADYRLARLLRSSASQQPRFGITAERDERQAKACRHFAIGTGRDRESGRSGLSQGALTSVAVAARRARHFRGACRLEFPARWHHCRRRALAPSGRPLSSALARQARLWRGTPRPPVTIWPERTGAGGRLFPSA